MSASSPNLVVTSSLLIASSLALEYVLQPQYEIVSECLCWLILLGGTKVYSQLRSVSSRPLNPNDLSTIIFGIALACLSSASEKRVWYSAPLLSIWVVAIQNGSTLLPQHKDFKEKEPASPTRTLSHPRPTYFFAFTLITVLALSQANPLMGAHLEICWFFAQAVLYYGLSNRTSQSSNARVDIIAESISTLSELSYFMVPITTSFVFLKWDDFVLVPEIGLFAMIKACRFFAILVLSHQSQLATSSWSTIFGVCTYSFSTYPQTWQAFLTVIGALGSLWNIAITFPQSSAARIVIIAFALCPIWAFGLYGGALPSSVSVTRAPGFSEFNHRATYHPIKKITEEARAKFEKTQRKQSKSLVEAIVEYKRRYGRNPPPGFDKWYEFAVKNKVQFVDEYDYMTNSFEPFWNIAPKILRDYAEQAIAFDYTSFNTLTIKNHTASLDGESFQHAQLVELIQPIVHLLPDLKAALNEYDEPRVLIPHDKKKATMLRSSDKAQQIYIGAQDRQKIWESVTIPCAPDSPARSLGHQQVLEQEPRFITNLSASQDICQWPSSATTRHGFLSSPSTFHFTHSYVPVLATAKFSTFSDIMIPSSYYFQDDIAEMDESKDSKWEDKKDQVYWRGSGTGGYWTKGSWRMGHRQRFVNFTNAVEGDIVLLKKSESGQWTPQHTKLSVVKNKFKVEFSQFIQCDDEDCQAQEDHFHLAKWDSNNDAVGSKIVYNLDGNSFSGRYYRLLKSNSLVFMQALFKEWHDDRLIPWVHFVPISNGMEELPETTRYLLDDPEGKIIAKRIAEEGKDWSKKVLRRIDMTAAYYRVFLEYARLVDDNRAKLV